MKRLKQPIFYLQWTLILFSIIAFVLATLDGFKMSFDISSIGFKKYLELFNPYAILFAATFVVITAHLAIERLGLMSDANNTAYKASNRTVWIQTTKEFLNELKVDNPFMCKEITKQLLTIHDYLFEKRYKISTSAETIEFFDKYFKNRVQFFEEMNGKFMSIACYRDNRQSYTWDSFRYIIIVMTNADECYPQFIFDLNQLYQQEILKFNSQYIDSTMYELAIKDYSIRKIEEARLKK